MSPLQFAAVLLALCADHNGSITAWKRTPKHNAAVGGNPNSHHLDGTGADVVLDDPKQQPAFLAAARTAGLHFLDEHDHIHLQTGPGPT